MSGKMIRVLYLYENLNIGGAEQLLVTTLKYLDYGKFKPLVYCIGKKGRLAEEVEKNGIPVKLLNKKSSLYNIGIVLELIKIFKRERPDVLHANLFYPGYFGRIAAFFAGVPVVIVTEHGTHSNLKKWYHYCIDFTLSFFTTKIIAVSCAVREYLLKYSRIRADKISVIYNAVDFERFDSVYDTDKDLIRSKLNFPGSDFLIGAVSNLAPWKGQHILLEAFRDVLKTFPEARLYIIGRDNNGFQHRLEKFAQENNFLEKVHFLGERRDVPQILRALDAFVLPSLSEGLGISLLEAMYLGLPAIASGTEGVLEIIEDNKDGLLFPPGDCKALAEKLIEVLKDREKAASLGVNAREKIKKRFSPQGYIEKLSALYLFK